MGWHTSKVTPKRFTAEASDLAGHVKAGGIPHCPKCGDEILRWCDMPVRKIRDDEGELLMSYFTHPCGSTLLVIND